MAFDNLHMNNHYPTAETKKGLVAFLDILGYRNLEKSSKTAGIVFGIIEKAQHYRNINVASVNPMRHCDNEVRLNLHVKESELRAGDKLESLVYEKIALSIISDSMVCTADLRKLSMMEKKIVVTVFIRMLSDIYSETLMLGLPIRGGVSAGAFYANDNPQSNKPATAFLGNAIFAAHRLEESVSGSIIVLDNSAKRKTDAYYDKNIPGSNIENSYSDICTAKVAIKVSRKDSKFEVKRLRHCINLPKTDDAFFRLHNDIESLVPFLFEQHGKKICEKSVKQKVKNTIDFLKNRDWDGKYDY